MGWGERVLNVKLPPKYWKATSFQDISFGGSHTHRKPFAASGCEHADHGRASQVQDIVAPLGWKNYTVLIT